MALETDQMSNASGLKYRLKSPLVIFFILFVTGFSMLLAFHFFFLNLTVKLDHLAENERGRMAIGKMIVKELQRVETKYYRLPTSKEAGFRQILLEDINDHLKTISNALTVIERGGAIRELVPLNLPESDKLVQIHKYQPINAEYYNLALLELRPELLIIQEFVEEIAHLVLQRDEYSRKGELNKLSAMIDTVKAQIKKNAHRFLRITEHADRLLYDSQIRLVDLERKVAKEKKYYILLEAMMALLTIAVILVLVMLISRQLMKSERELKEKITELDTSKENLVLAHRRTVHILDGLDAVVYVADVKNREILFINRFAQNQFGDVLGKKCYEVFQEAGRTLCSYCAFQTHPIEGTRFERTVWEYQNGGCWKEAHGQKIRWGRDSYAFLVILLDITSRKEAEQKRDQVTAQLHRKQKMEAIGTLAGGISHDFNNILSAIIGFTELCELEVEPESEMASYLSHIHIAGNRAKNLVSKILTFSQKADISVTPIELSSIIKEALDLLRASLPTTIQIEFNSENTHNLIMADSVQIHQVIMNLGTNALHAMHEQGGTLTIELSSIYLDENAAKTFSEEFKPGNYEEITISDTGCGMDDETIKQIFDPFFTTRQKGKGTGLGLSTVHGIVKSYGGAIRTTSVPGFGTAFTILFPVCKNNKLSNAEVKESQIAKGTERILYVDDEESVVKVITKLLDFYGYKTTGLTDSVKALELFAADPNRFDLVITDYTMPKMTGEELSLALLEIRPDLPIIICTGFSEKLDKQAAKQMGVNDLLKKPVTTSLLTSTIRKIFDSI